MIPKYPDFRELDLSMRPVLHPLFQSLDENVSEFTFANVYLFRNRYGYRVSSIDERVHVLVGERDGKRFFLLPFGVPSKEVLGRLFRDHGLLKLATERITAHLAGDGYSVREDRGNFDYLYLREKLASLDGKKLHKKRNLVNAFINSYSFLGKTLWADNIADALAVLGKWHQVRGGESDYDAAKEALERHEELGLCGSIVYVDGVPAGYTQGEELGRGACFAVHFEKAIESYKGIYQFMNKCFSSFIPEKFMLINREQDMDEDGLRQAKMSYKPHDFVKKYVVEPV